MLSHIGMVVARAAPKVVWAPSRLVGVEDAKNSISARFVTLKCFSLLLSAPDYFAFPIL